MKVYGITPQVTGYSNSMKGPQRVCAAQTLTKPSFIQPIESPPLIYPTVNPYPINSGYANAQSINFGYKSILKTQWLKGNMPSVKFDMGGNRLTKNNISLGHMLPHSKGGPTSLSNLMLETKGYNMMKGNSPFSMFFDKEAFESYCEQFKDIDLPDFNGKAYIELITKTAERLIKQGK